MAVKLHFKDRTFDESEYELDFVQPIGRSYLIAIEKQPEKTKSGLYLGGFDNEENRPETGFIVRVGKEVRGIDVGDYVVFRKFNLSTEPLIEDENYDYMLGADYEKDILAIIKLKEKKDA